MLANNNEILFTSHGSFSCSHSLRTETDKDLNYIESRNRQIYLNGTQPENILMTFSSYRHKSCRAEAEQHI